MNATKYCMKAWKYAEKLRNHGYGVRFHWTDPNGIYYSCVSIFGPVFRGYGGEYPTTEIAWERVKELYHSR